MRIQANPGQKMTSTSLIYTLAFWGLAILIFLTPFFRGLFFEGEQVKALIWATIVFWLVCLGKYTKRDYSFFSHPLDYFILALPLAYILASFNAVNTGLAVTEVVKNLLYFMAYWIVVQLVRQETDLYKLLHVIYLAAVGVALAGLATATGLISINDGFVGGRIYSTFQYPNALASYLAMASFIGFLFWLVNGQLTLGTTIKNKLLIKAMSSWLGNIRLYGYLYSMANFVLLAVLFGTKSRGGLLITGVVFCLYIIGLTWQQRLPVLIYALFSSGLAYYTVEKFIALAIAQQAQTAWLWFLGGLLLVLGFQVVYNWLANVIANVAFLNEAKHQRRLRLIVNGTLVGLVVVALLAGIVLFNSNPAYLEKIQSFNYLRSATARFDFVNDAITMIKDRPLIGWGGGGWKEAYRAYQSYLYTSNEIHSYYFQVGVETGILGLLAVLAIWVSFFGYSWQAYRRAGQGNKNSLRTVIWTLMAATLAVGTHGLIDFDLSLSALALALWVLFAGNRAIWELAPSPEKVVNTSPKHLDPAAQPGNNLLSSTDQKSDGQKSEIDSVKKNKKKNKYKNKHQQPDVAQEKQGILLKKSGKSQDDASRRRQRKQKLPQAKPVWLALLSGVSFILLSLGICLTAANSSIRIAVENLQMGNLAQGISYAEKATAYHPINANYRMILSQLYLNTNQPEQAIAEAQKAVLFSQYNAQMKENLANIYLATGKNLEAVESARQMVECAPYQVNWYETLCSILTAVGRSELMNGNNDQARSYLEEAVRVPDLFEPRLAALSDYQQKMWSGARLSPTPRLRLAMGQAKYYLGEWAEAEKDLQAALKDKQLTEQANFWLALVKDKQGKDSEARDLLNKAINQNPEYNEAFEQYKQLATLKG